MDSAVKEEYVDYQTSAFKRIRRIESLVRARLWKRLGDLQVYYEGKQNRHRGRGDVSQNKSYPYDSTINIIREAFRSPYHPDSCFSQTMLLDYRVVPTIKNELSGLFHADERALRKMLIFLPSEQIPRSVLPEISSGVVLETLNYLEKYFSGFFKRADLNFFPEISGLVSFKPHG